MPDTKRDGLPWNTVCCSCLCDISHVYACCFFSDCIINSLYFCHTTFMGTLSFCYVTFLRNVFTQHLVATVRSPHANPGNERFKYILPFFFFLPDKLKTSVQQCTDISRWAVFFSPCVYEGAPSFGAFDINRWSSWEKKQNKTKKWRHPGYRTYSTYLPHILSTVINATLNGGRDGCC